MTSALLGIALAFFLSLSSLVVVILRVSPLTAPQYALAFFFLSLFGALASFVALFLALIKSFAILRPWHGSTESLPSLKTRKIIGGSLRQGMFFALASTIIVFLWILRIANWWIAVLIYIVFVLIELAMGRS
ncbi:MAG TPA: hypothetical protein VJB82_00145 [Candidatus Peribacterales bacterium]|nr:hypothetical protein [Candidatus Peribacterales bacterium]